jgi:hypothetical protein
MKTIAKVFINIILAAIIIVGFGLITTSCTENSRARNWGGTEKIELNKNEVLIGATWKGNDLWIGTTDTVTGVSYFREHSSMGVVEGEIIFNPSK